MEKTITCGSCYKEFIPFTYPVIFEDCALVFTNCPSCEFEILLAIVKDAEFYSLQRRITYGVLAERMKSEAEFINDRTNLKSARNQTAHELLNTLTDFTKDSSLDELTKIFTAHPDKGSQFKYSAASISKFINVFYNKFQPFTKFDYLGNMDSFSWIEDNFRSLAITSDLLAELDSADPPTVEPQFMQIKANLRTLTGNFPFGQEMGEYMENMPSKRSINQEIKNENLAIIDVAKTMYQKYTNRQTNLINLFQVTDKIIPLEPSREEKAAREFFKNNPDDQIVLPGPASLNIFQADRERFLALLAQASLQPIKIVTDSTLTYNLFLSQIAREIEQYSNHPILSQITLLSSPHARSVPGFRTVSFLSQFDFDSQELNNDQGPQTTYLLPKNHLYETGRFIGPVTFQLSQPSVSDLEYILGQFAPNIAQLYHVQFTDKVFTELALGTQNIHTSVPSVDQAINWLDEVAAASTLKNTASPITVTVSDVQRMFASKYNSYATTAFDTNTIRQLEAHLNKHVIAQPKATKAVTDALMRASLGLNNPNRPLATMLFVGPTGVGKTELAKQLAFELYGSETEFIRFDMSEYVDERSSILKFIGLTGQYKNSEIEGELIVAVRDHPNAIILFDEFEKSSRSIQNLMLQILDEGRITSGRGVTYSLKQNIILFTSNAGIQFADAHMGFGSADRTAKFEFSADRLAETFSPELQNRFSHIIEFDSLDTASLFKILELKLKRFYKHFASLGIKLNIPNDVKTKLVELGNNPEFGARPLDRAIDNYLITAISNLLISTANVHDITVKLDANDKIYSVQTDQKINSRSQIDPDSEI